MVPVTQQWVDSCVITQQSLNAARLGNRNVGVKTWRSIGNVGGMAYLGGSRFTSHVAVLAPYVKYMSCFLAPSGPPSSSLSRLLLWAVHWHLSAFLAQHCQFWNHWRKAEHCISTDSSKDHQTVVMPHYFAVHFAGCYYNTDRNEGCTFLKVL